MTEEQPQQLKRTIAGLNELETTVALQRTAQEVTKKSKKGVLLVLFRTKQTQKLDFFSAVSVGLSAVISMGKFDDKILKQKFDTKMAECKCDAEVLAGFVKCLWKKGRKKNRTYFSDIICNVVKRFYYCIRNIFTKTSKSL